MSWFPVAHHLAGAGVTVACVKNSGSRRYAITLPNMPKLIRLLPRSWPPCRHLVDHGFIQSTFRIRKATLFNV
ncbi:hypothetical protein [Gluconobacter cerinus]|uniref:hypothetical protein n=1 Tax=Gluconobacter cerinus TaxID=38307 RepID=UPI001B8B8AA2|nr:hypothetical protein [Gluconobacter cerinus]MBS1038746.1 hypothetical protein [Gluconobacter cerinus]